MSLVLGSLSAPAFSRAIETHPVMFMGITSAGRAAAYALCASGAEHKVIALPFAMNPVAAFIVALQHAAGSAIVAASLSRSHRYALLFSANTLMANGIAAVLGNVGAHLSWGANSYYWAVACTQLALLVAAPFLFASRPRLIRTGVDLVVSDCAVLHELDTTHAAPRVVD
uniref:Uncharacterized protein n=1 Tax=Haptolina ericina TaxID=156174 RepID=A0A7S3AEX5_9EUKA|mmetsp:Transcript_13463/g.30573  ORF Transcript_13463/g.30573 Transcript_13463/m.30573 type:complete len:170 (+) Transcript_13463:276-785(+)